MIYSYMEWCNALIEFLYVFDSSTARTEVQGATIALSQIYLIDMLDRRQLKITHSG